MRIKTEAPTRSMHRRPPMSHGLDGIRLMAWVLAVVLPLLVKVTAMEHGNWADYGRLAEEINDGISTAAESLLGGVNNAGPAGRATLGEGSRSMPVSTGVRYEKARPSSFEPSHAGRRARLSDEVESSDAVRSVRQRTAAPSQLLRGNIGLYSDTRAYLSSRPPTSRLKEMVEGRYADVRDHVTQQTGPFPQSLKVYYDKLQSANEELYSKLDRVTHPNGYVSYQHPGKDIFATPEHTDAAIVGKPRFSSSEERRLVELLLLEHLSDHTGWKALLDGPIFVLSPHMLIPVGRREEELLALFDWDNDVIGQPPLDTLDNFNINDYRIELGQSLDYPGSPYGLPIYPIRARHLFLPYDEQIQVGFIHYPLGSDGGRHLLRSASGHYDDKHVAMPVDDDKSR